MKSADKSSRTRASQIVFELSLCTSLVLHVQSVIILASQAFSFTS